MIENPKSNPFIELLRTNINLQTGIRYGTIYGNDISPESIDEIISSGTDLTFEESRDEFISDLSSDIEDLINSKDKYSDLCIEDIDLSAASDRFSENYDDMCTGVYEYSQKGYLIRYSSEDNSIIVLKSPYYTISRLASPCFPNGVYLKDYDKDNGYMAYCLGADFFDPEYSHIPYEIFNVSDLPPEYQDNEILEPDE